jgi:hypothetical protein
MTAAAPSSAFITDAIADFKGRLDTLMEESLSKYREKAIADMGEDYTPGYGEITELVSGSYRVQNSSIGEYSLCTQIPSHKFNKQVWLIHSFKYDITGRIGDGWNAHTGTIGMCGYAIDNYGSIYNYSCSAPDGNNCWETPTVGVRTHIYPLTNSLINLIKTIPVDLGSFTRRESLHTFINELIIPIVKHSAETIYKSRQATLQLRKELEAERAKTAALEAELRALKASSPPAEDLLGLTDIPPPVATPASALATAIMEL